MEIAQFIQEYWYLIIALIAVVSVVSIKAYIGTDNYGNDYYEIFENPTEDVIKWEVNE